MRTTARALASQRGATPKFPDIEYDVVKVNLRGRKQQRILKLTENEILNVRGKVVSSSHTYEDVFCVTLQDHQTLVLSYPNEHEYKYVSPIATSIVTEINQRLAARRTKEKHDFTHNLAIMPLPSPHAPGPDQVSRGLMTGTIAEEGTGANESYNVMADPKTRDQLLSVLREGTPGLKKEPSRTSRKLQALTGVSERQRWEQVIDSIVLDPKTDEGKARTRFHKNMSVLEKSPTTILGVVRQFMDSLSVFVETKREAEIEQKHATMGAEGGSDKMPYIEVSIERAVVLPMYQRITRCLLKETAPKEAKIAEQLLYLRSKHQPFYGIGEAEVSANNWSSAIFELSFMDKKMLPCEKLEVLLNTARAVYNNYNYEKNRLRAEERLSQSAHLAAGGTPPTKLSTKNFFLPADEFFPIFVYVVVNADIEYHELTKQYMWGLCEKNALSGEGGYYLTVYEACVEYIHNFKPGKHTSGPRGSESRKTPRT